MPIRLVVNGFFRSGTSIVWSILRASNPSHDVFYEPCHGDLLRRIETFRRCAQADPVHAMCLWEEYLQDPGLLDRLRATHPNVGRPFPDNLVALLPYLNAYHTLPRDSILQTNRWHFFLQGIHEETECGIVHLVRNPFDIYRSIARAYLTTGDLLDRTTKRMLWWAWPGRAFQIREMADYIILRYGLPSQAVGVRGAVRSRLMTNWRQFLLVWVVSNFEAMRQVERIGHLVTSCEALLREPEMFAGALADRYGVAFQHQGMLRSSHRARFVAPEQHLQLARLADDMGIRHELEYVISRLCV